MSSRTCGHHPQDRIQAYVDAEIEGDSDDQTDSPAPYFGNPFYEEGYNEEDLPAPAPAPYMWADRHTRAPVPSKRGHDENKPAPAPAPALHQEYLKNKPAPAPAPTKRNSRVP